MASQLSIRAASILLVFFCAASARAGVTTYNSRAAFEAAASGTLTTLDFAGITPHGSDKFFGSSAKFGGVKFVITPSADGGEVYIVNAEGASYHVQSYLLWQNGYKMTVTLPGPTTAVGFDNGSFWGNGYNYQLAIGAQAYPYNGVSGANVFFGIISDTPFTSFVMTTPGYFPSYPSIEGFSFNSTAPANSPPVASAGLDRTVAAGPACEASVQLDGSASSDPDGDVLTYAWSWSDSSASGTATGARPAITLPLGAHVISLTVDDGRGATATATTTITVKDQTPPSISLASVSPEVLWPPNHRMVAMGLAVAVSDNCDPNPSWRVVSVTSNEAVDADLDWLFGDRALQLRADRSGAGSGRVYSVTIGATDAAGNQATIERSVTVPHDNR